MDLIVTDATGKPVASHASYTLDLAFGSGENDFDLQVEDAALKAGSRIMIDGTEYGGIIDDTDVDVDGGLSTVTWHGRDWHGVLASKIIEPDRNNDYLTLSGTIPVIMRTLVSRAGLQGLFTVTDESADHKTTCQFDRYVDLYSGLVKMLRASGLKLRLRNDGDKVSMSAMPVRTIGDSIDSDLIDFTAKQAAHPINHLICLGKGELKDRTVIHWYADANGTFSHTQTLKGLDERTATYELSNAEADELEDKGRQKFQELRNTSTIDVDIPDGIDADVGDLVTGRDNNTGLVVTAELETRGAQSGLVVEVDEIANIEKIQPNQTPSGLDRVSYKAEEHIKSISGVSDYMQGFAREDVAAKSVQTNKQSGQANLAKVMDNMNRSDFILARAVLDLVQEYYTEQRLLYITTDRLMNTTEQMTVNQPTPEGRIVNDLTLGEYAIVVTNQPERDTFEDTQFDQAVRLRTEAGVQIPDKYILQSSRLKEKAQIISEMEQAGQTPEAKQQAELQMRALAADVATKEAEATQKGSDAQLKQAKAQKEIASIGEDSGQNEIALEQQKLEAEMAMEQQKLDQEFQLKQEQMNREFELKREQLQMEMALKREQATAEAAIKATVAKEQAKAARVAAVHNAQPPGEASPTSPAPGAPAKTPKQGA